MTMCVTEERLTVKEERLTAALRLHVVSVLMLPIEIKTTLTDQVIGMKRQNIVEVNDLKVLELLALTLVIDLPVPGKEKSKWMVQLLPPTLKETK